MRKERGLWRKNCANSVKHHYFHKAGPVTASFGIAVFEEGFDEKTMLEKGG